MLRAMPAILVTRRARSHHRLRRPSTNPSVVVVGDIVVDVILAPERDLEHGSDVRGRVQLRAGGSAATAARWLGRLGARSSLVCAVGRDGPGRALVAAASADGVIVRAVHIAGARTARIGVFIDPDGGQRSFVQDRGAALLLAPEHLRPAWFEAADAVHLPAYSLLDEPLGRAGMEAIRLARAAGALVTVDLASSAPLLAFGRRRSTALIREVAPDLLFTTRDEAKALLGPKYEERLLELAPIAVVKRGRKGASIHVRADSKPLRLDVATTPIAATDTTGAGDAFDAGFLLAWLAARHRGVAPAVALRRGAVAGNRAALRQLLQPRSELSLG
jgi:sugar/nucleoside kinase (ribokinase family)